MWDIKRFFNNCVEMIRSENFKDYHFFMHHKLFTHEKWPLNENFFDGMIAGTYVEFKLFIEDSVGHCGIVSGKIGDEKGFKKSLNSIRSQKIKYPFPASGEITQQSKVRHSGPMITAYLGKQIPGESQKIFESAINMLPNPASNFYEIDMQLSGVTNYYSNKHTRSFKWKETLCKIDFYREETLPIFDKIETRSISSMYEHFSLLAYRFPPNRKKIKDLPDKAPIILHQKLAEKLFRLILNQNLNPGNYLRKQSIFHQSGIRKMGCLTIHDNPSAPRGIHSRPIDAEGVQTRKKTLIREGSLVEPLLTMAYLKHIASKPGNAIEIDKPGLSNIEVEAPADQLRTLPADYIRVVNTRKLVCNYISGEFELETDDAQLFIGNEFTRIVILEVRGNLYQLLNDSSTFYIKKRELSDIEVPSIAFENSSLREIKIC